MTRYQPVAEEQFKTSLRRLQDRVGTLESRTNAVGTNADGSVSVSNLYVVGDTGSSLSITPNDTTQQSPAIRFSGNVPDITASPAVINTNVVGTAPNLFEVLFLDSPVGAGDTDSSIARVSLISGGTGTDAAHGNLAFKSASLNEAVVQWDQWGITARQPASGSFPGGAAVVTGSVLQNDTAAFLGGSAPKFFHAAGYSGTTNSAGELTFSHGCQFTPQGAVVNVNAGGVGFNLMVGVESTGFTSTTAKLWVLNAMTAAPYASSFLTFYALLWG